MKTAFRPVDRTLTAFRFDEFTFDCNSRMLRRGAAEQHLSPKAQHLLQLLLAACPRALSREELYDALWPSTFVCETNMAGVVREVRRALGDDARESQYIRTVHGFGYAFCGDVVAVQPERSPVSAMLVCEGHRYPLREGENLVGRAHDGCVVLNDATVSRRHAVISISDGEMWVQDLDSKNGTYVDQQKVTRSRLMHRTRIGFGAVNASIIRRDLSSTQSLRLRYAGDGASPEWVTTS